MSLPTRRPYRHVLFGISALIALTGCPGDKSAPTGPGGGAVTGSYTLGVNAATTGMSIPQGRDTTIDVVITRTGGHTANVNLSVDPPRAGISGDVTVLANPVGTTVARLKISAAPAAPPGSATVVLRAKSAGLPDQTVSIQLTVTETVASVSIETNDAMLDYLQKESVFAVARSATGNVIAGRHTVWSTADTAVLQVQPSGNPVQMEGVGGGQTFIFAHVDGIIGTRIITVSRGPIHTIIVTGERGGQTFTGTATLTQGLTMQFAAEARDSRGKRINTLFNWSSSNSGIASVDSRGLVTAVGAGTAIITAESEGVRGTFELVVPQLPIGSVKVSPDYLLGLVGDAGRFTATVHDNRGAQVSGVPIRWSSDDAAIVLVDAVTGDYTLKAPGLVNVRATVMGYDGVPVVGIISVLVQQASPPPTTTQWAGTAPSATFTTVVGSVGKCAYTVTYSDLKVTASRTLVAPTTGHFDITALRRVTGATPACGSGPETPTWIVLSFTPGTGAFDSNWQIEGLLGPDFYLKTRVTGTFPTSGPFTATLHFGYSTSSSGNPAGSATSSAAMTPK